MTQDTLIPSISGPLNPTLETALSSPVWGSSSQSVAPRSAAWALPGNLVEMQISGLSPDGLNLEFWGGAQQYCSISPLGGLQGSKCGTTVLGSAGAWSQGRTLM